MHSEIKTFGHCLPSSKYANLPSHYDMTIPNDYFSPLFNKSFNRYQTFSPMWKFNSSQTYFITINSVSFRIKIIVFIFKRMTTFWMQRTNLLSSNLFYSRFVCFMVFCLNGKRKVWLLEIFSSAFVMIIYFFHVFSYFPRQSEWIQRKIEYNNKM